MEPEHIRDRRRFAEEMATVDDLAHVLLKGHLLLEEALSRIIDVHVFHEEHLAEARLTFAHKMSIARALCLRKNLCGEWELIAAINSLRNDLAHRLNSDARAKKLSRVKELYFREAAGYPNIESVRSEPDATIVMFACAHCFGFLSSFESDARALRQMLHVWDKLMNPDLERIRL